MKKSKDYSKLCDRINTNEYLLLRLADKSAGGSEDTSVTMQRAHSKEAARIQLYKDLLEWMPFRNRNLFSKVDDTILPDIEKGARDALNSAAKRCEYYDPVAFEKTMNDAISSFEKNRGTQFTTWFRDLYAQRVTKLISDTVDISNQIFKSKMSKSEIKAYRSFLDYIRKAGISADSLSDELLEKVAAHVGHDKEWLRNLLSVYNAQFNISSANITIDEDSEDEVLLDLLGDPTSATPFLTEENLDELTQLVDIVATADTKEYTRLFWNNLFLHPLKDVLSEREVNYTSSPIDYLKVLKAIEVILIGRIFVKPYLCFCLRTPPEPDTLDNIYECESFRPFIQKTICEYKNVSAAYASQQRKKFELLQCEIKNKFYDKERH